MVSVLMGRPKRADDGGLIDHVLNRANARMTIFEDEVVPGPGRRALPDILSPISPAEDAGRGRASPRGEGGSPARPHRRRAPGSLGRGSTSRWSKRRGPCVSWDRSALSFLGLEDILLRGGARRGVEPDPLQRDPTQPPLQVGQGLDVGRSDRRLRHDGLPAVLETSTRLATILTSRGFLGKGRGR